MPEKWRGLLVAVGLVGLSGLCGGCMTLDHLIDSEEKLEMYGGTTKSWAYVSDPGSSFFGTLIRLIDLPATVVGDTLMLPISAPVELSRGGG